MEGLLVHLDFFPDRRGAVVVGRGQVFFLGMALVCSRCRLAILIIIILIIMLISVLRQRVHLFVVKVQSSRQDPLYPGRGRWRRTTDRCGTDPGHFLRRGFELSSASSGHDDGRKVLLGCCSRCGPTDHRFVTALTTGRLSGLAPVLGYIELLLLLLFGRPFFRSLVRWSSGSEGDVTGPSVFGSRWRGFFSF